MKIIEILTQFKKDPMNKFLSDHAKYHQIIFNASRINQKNDG